MGFRSMAAVIEPGSDYYPVGCVAVCETIHKRRVEGEVLAFDPQTKMLILKCQSSCGKASQFDVHIVNVNYCSVASIKKEATVTPPPPLQSLNLNRLSSRIRTNLEEKSRLVNAMAAGVSPEGQRLFLVISKTYDEIVWQGDSIVVMNRVVVTPPYHPENCKAVNNDNRAAENQIRKIIEKHMKDQEMQQLQLQQQSETASASASASASMNSTPSTPPPSSPSQQTQSNQQFQAKAQ